MKVKKINTLSALFFTFVIFISSGTLQTQASEIVK